MYLKFAMLLFMIFDKFIIFIGANILIVVKIHRFFIYTLMCRNCMDIRQITKRPLIAVIFKVFQNLSLEDQFVEITKRVPEDNVKMR
jgi:hypothetical protein